MEAVCSSCPRKCAAPRSEYAGTGFCRAPALPVVARAAPHFGEEPCVSGSRGSGTVFFCGCNLRCAFCQNFGISRGVEKGRTVTLARLGEIFGELRDLGVHNLNLVTPSHYAKAVRSALGLYPPGIPVVWNSSGYDDIPALGNLEGLVNVYMPDLKYLRRDLARSLSAAPDYPETAKAAILEMYRQTGPFVLDGEGLMTRGLLIRHLMLPGELENTFDAIDWVSETFPKGAVMFSLMAQYTPMGVVPGHPALSRRVSEEEYARAVRYLSLSGITAGYVQELSSAGTAEIPEFDGTGVSPG